MTMYALGMLLMLGFIVLLVVAGGMIFMMESLELDNSFLEDTLRDTTMSLAPVSLPPSPENDLP